ESCSRNGAAGSLGGGWIVDRQGATCKGDRLREIALAFGGGRNARSLQQFTRVVVALQRGGKERAVAAVVKFRNEDRSGNGVPQLAILRGGFGQTERVVGPTGGVQRAPLLEEVHRAVNIV